VRLKLTSWEIFHRRMDRYAERPSTTCAACGKAIRKGTRRTYVEIEVPHRALLAVHPRCAAAPLKPTADALAAGAALQVYEAARELLDAMDDLPASEKARGGRLLESMGSTVRYVMRLACRRARSRK
jgi:hypothetical protein